MSAADPITPFAVSTATDSLFINHNHTLTVEDLQLLAARDDRGLHLGWFTREDGAAFSLPAAVAVAANRQPRASSLGSASGGATTTSRDVGPDPLAGTEVPRRAQPHVDLAAPPVAATLGERTMQAVTSIAEIPEPSAVLLLGGGLMSLGQRLRRRRR